jgi:hypothetical protein
LFRNLKARRERLHEVASRKHKQVLEELAKVRDENKEHVWTWWTVSFLARYVGLADKPSGREGSRAMGRV